MRRIFSRCCAHADERPRRRAAEQRDELAPPHGFLSAGGLQPITRCRKCRVVHHSKIEHRMAELGQNAKNSHRAYLVRFTPLATEERTFGIGSSVPIATQCIAAGGYSITSSAIATESSGQLREKFCHVRRSGSSGLSRSAEVAVFCTVKNMYSK